MPLDGDEEQRRRLPTPSTTSMSSSASRRDSPSREQHRVLCDHDAHGSSARTIVGPPAGLEMVSVPSTVAARGRQALEAAAGFDPGAADAVVLDLDHDDVPVLRLMRTSSRVAAACLVAFVNASATTKYAVDSTATDGRLSRSTEISTGTGCARRARRGRRRARGR